MAGRKAMLPAFALAGAGLLGCVIEFSGDDFVPDRPFEGEWETVVDEVPFPVDQITTLRVGGLATLDNFANRGHVEVFYVHATEVITVQMRQFTFAEDQEDADGNMADGSVWAYALETPELDPDPDLDCSASFTDGCHLRFVYDGLSQPLRDGADIRVFLPRDWAGNLFVGTEDLEAELETYPRRSQVFVKGARGNVFVESMGSGTVEIEMAEDLEDAPDSALQTIRAENKEGRAANMTVEVPSDLYVEADLETKPTCLAELDCAEFDSCERMENADECYEPGSCWEVNATLNDPDEALAPVFISLVSSECRPVTDAPSPDDYDDPITEPHGTVRLCTDCLDISVPPL